jgi:hypothetical protein
MQSGQDGVHPSYQDGLHPSLKETTGSATVGNAVHDGDRVWRNPAGLPLAVADRPARTATFAPQRRQAPRRSSLPHRRRTSGRGAVVDISVVAPVYNEKGNLLPLHQRLVAVLADLGRAFEIIYVDDGSADGSFDELKELAEHDPRARIVRLRRNFGQTAAIGAGVDNARGQFIVLIDADNQNDPSDIPRLMAVAEQGYDVVSGWRQHRQDAASRTLPSHAANRLISAVTGVNLHDYGCTLKVYRGDLLRQLKLYGEMHRFIPAYLAQLGARVTELPVTHHPRVVGRSKYGMSRIFRVILDLLTVKFFATYHTRPMHLFGVLGLVCLVLSAVTALAMIVQKIALGVSMIQTPLLVLAAVLLLMGTNALFLGLLGELVMRTYFEAQRKRPYQVRSMVNFERRD